MSENLKIVLALVGIVLLVYLVHSYNKSHESFTNDQALNEHQGLMDYNTSPSTQAQEIMQEKIDYSSNAALPEQISNEEQEEVQASESSNPSGNETYASINGGDSDSPFDLKKNQLPADCYPKDQLTPKDLLPQDPNSTWAQVNPSGQGELKDQNFLNAGYHVGINTVGQTLRNANLQLRSEPPNPQMKVSPWQQSTIEPDTNRRAMEIGGCE